MRARIGDLAIVRFDLSYEEDGASGRKYDEKVGIVIGCKYYQCDCPTVTVYVKDCHGESYPELCQPKRRLNKSREYEFIYWDKIDNKIEIRTGTLPPSRLVRARPKIDDWEGTLSSLTRDKVEPVCI